MPTPEIDLHLLRCLDALVRERHVTRAGEAMGMSQSAMSVALGKLRAIFDDPILVRTPQGMQLSERAPEIAASVRRAIKELEQALSSAGAFDPASSRLTVSLMASDYVGALLVPPLVAHLRREAPGMSLRLVPAQPRRVREALANAEADLSVGFFHNVSEGLYQTVLMMDRLVCVASVDHPVVKGELTLEHYAAAEHVFYGSPPEFTSSTEMLLDETLPRLGVDRRISAFLPSLPVAPAVIAASDLLGTIPQRIAMLPGFSGLVTMVPLPFATPPLPVRALWHERMHGNEAHRWLRATLKSVASTLGELPAL